MKNPIILVFFSLVFMFSCADFIPPTGGKRDEKAPELINSYPKNKTLNYKGKSLSLEFNEYLDISSLKQDLLIIPNIEGNYTVKQKGKSVILNFDKPFKDSTTYTFNFRTGIKDLNERNPATNLRLVFSTGTFIDSLNLKGTVKEIKFKEAILNATVALYKLDTTPISKRKPDYFIKTDSSGNFNLENIKAQSYRIIAFTDQNNNLNYDQKTEKLAFRTDTVHLRKSLELEPLELYISNRLKNKIKKNVSRENEFIIQLDKPIKSVSFQNFSGHYYLKDPTNLLLFPLGLNKPQDSTDITLYTIDSLNLLDTLKTKLYFNKATKKTKIGPFNIFTETKNSDFLTRDIEYILKFDSPIVRFDSTKLKFLTDTSQIEKPIHKWISKNELMLSIKTKAKEKVSLVFLSNAFENLKADTSESFSITNNILAPEDLASVSGNFKENSPKIVHLIDAEKRVILKSVECSSTYYFQNIIPGNYHIQAIYDSNRNGIWDAGNIYTNTPPEKIILTKNPIKIKANFEIKNLIID
jgi:hypothetical protein